MSKIISSFCSKVYYYNLIGSYLCINEIDLYYLNIILI